VFQSLRARPPALRSVAREAGVWLWRRLRLVVFSAYYAAVAANHRHELWAPAKTVGTASFRSFELVNKHGRDRLLRRLVAAVEPGDVVVDAGANTGVYALAVAANQPAARVVAFEPAPGVVAQCRTNVRRNGFEDRVTVRQAGLAATSGEATFYRSSYDELGSFARENAGAWEASVRDELTVPTAALDDLVAAGEVPPPDHLKVDVEGTERAVLEGAVETLRTHRPVVYLEVHDAPGAEREDHEAALRALLTDCGYRVDRTGSAWYCRPVADPGQSSP
jgi:FkbM family methyltransferase